MEVVYLKSFFGDLKNVKDQQLRKRVKSFIIALENADSLESLPNITKMKGYSIAYRARIGNYRLGLYYDNQVIELVRFVKRNDIYKVFPD